MKNHKIIYPGSFDPFTNGHEYIIKNASNAFPDSTLFIIVANNQDKKHMFDIDERTKMVKKSVKKMNLKTKIKVISFDGITSNFIIDNKISIVIRGIRNNEDFEYERNIEFFTMETTGVQTLYFSNDPKNMSVSSSIVRSFINLGFMNKIKDIVPKSIFKIIQKKKR